MLLSEFAQVANGRVSNLDTDFEINAATSFDVAGSCDVCVVTTPKLNTAALSSAAGAFIVKQGNVLPGRVCVEVADPWLAMAGLLSKLHPISAVQWFRGIHPSAVIHESAVLGANVTVGPNVVIGPGSVLGAGCYLYPGVVIGPNVSIGDDCLFESNVVIEANTRIGNRVIIHAGSVIGSDGFKYEIVSVGRIKIPQVGCVVIEDDCEIGSCSCVDRAGFTETRIGARTKIDNLVQVGHNCVIGNDCVIVSQTGVAGSCKLGNWVILAAKVGIADHVTINDGAIVMAGSNVMREVPAGEHVLGTPAVPVTQELRIKTAQNKLPEMRKEMLALRRRIEELEKRLDGSSSQE
ncbi:MAG: UDP-3-O-(3-hydroxymyristoyl)glucosamine N-acyltransferase [Candidatus Sumerlaeales bacterium]|nr:UDP-3-O-(3-hydroxymyristoyl)glucosamine N-acyltransferase [Candidatus Sumerlaeales bacterium]